jgi:hypothetical protein
MVHQIEWAATFNRQVAEEMLGRPLRSGEIVHHRDGNKRNNDQKNLSVTTQSAHIRVHLPEMHTRRKVKTILKRIAARLAAGLSRRCRQVSPVALTSNNGADDKAIRSSAPLQQFSSTCLEHRPAFGRLPHAG